MKKIILSLIALFCVFGVALAIFLHERKEELGENLSFDNLHTYTNDDMGFEIGILEDMTIDDNLQGIVTQISNKDISLSIFYDDFTNSTNDYNTYVWYANRFLDDTQNHKLIEEKITEINGKYTHFLAYSRKKLSKLENDKNYYCSAEIKVSDKEVYTILVKTNSEDLTQAKSIISSFKVIGKPTNTKLEDGHFKVKELNKNEKTKEIYNKYFSDEATLTWGIFEAEAPKKFENVNSIEEKIGYDFKFLIRYQSFNTELPSEEINEAAKLGKIIELSPQTMNTNQGEIDIYEILDGKYDEYLNKYAQDIKNLDTPILFRINNEMNGDWCGYCAFHYAKDAELYKETWKYIYDIFEKNGVDNVLWVWNPNHKSFPNFNYNNALVYYPGDEYVDIVGLTAYNTGNYYPGEQWSTFDELYKEYYEEYSRIFEKPLMITEFGASIFGGDKIKWTQEMFNSLKNYPRIKVAIWWSHIDYDAKGNEARVYRIDRPSEVLDVFKENVERDG